MLHFFISLKIPFKHLHLRPFLHIIFSGVCKDLFWNAYSCCNSSSNPYPDLRIRSGNLYSQCRPQSDQSYPQGPAAKGMHILCTPMPSGQFPHSRLRNCNCELLRPHFPVVPDKYLEQSVSLFCNISLSFLHSKWVRQIPRCSLRALFYCFSTTNFPPQMRHLNCSGCRTTLLAFCL